MASAWNLVCGRYINFEKGTKVLTLLTFGWPTDKKSAVPLLERHG